MEQKKVEKELLSADDLCVYLNLSITTVYKLMKQEDFPTVKIGRKKFVLKSDLNEWIQNHKEGGRN